MTTILTDPQLEQLNEKVAAEPNEAFVAILFCPVCCTTVDVQGTGLQVLYCNHCDQTWAMQIVPSTIDTYAIN